MKGQVCNAWKAAEKKEHKSQDIFHMKSWLYKCGSMTFRISIQENTEFLKINILFWRGGYENHLSMTKRSNLRKMKTSAFFNCWIYFTQMIFCLTIFCEAFSWDLNFIAVISEWMGEPRCSTRHIWTLLQSQKPCGKQHMHVNMFFKTCTMGFAFLVWYFPKHAVFICKGFMPFPNLVLIKSFSNYQIMHKFNKKIIK